MLQGLPIKAWHIGGGCPLSHQAFQGLGVFHPARLRPFRFRRSRFRCSLRRGGQLQSKVDFDRNIGVGPLTLGKIDGDGRYRPTVAAGR